MSISENDRRALFDELAAAIGPDNAGILMEFLPRSPSAELATRTDIQAETIMLRGEMAELRSELRGEMAELRSELRGEMAELRSELRSDLAALRGGLSEVRSESIADFASMKSHVDERFNGLIASQAQLVEQMGALRHDLASWLITSWLATAGLIVGLVVVMYQVN